jgi:hypothetical protein
MIGPGSDLPSDLVPASPSISDHFSVERYRRVRTRTPSQASCFYSISLLWIHCCNLFQAKAGNPLAIVVVAPLVKGDAENFLPVLARPASHSRPALRIWRRKGAQLILGEVSQRAQI